MFVQRVLSPLRGAPFSRFMAVNPGIMKKGALHNYVDSLQDIIMPYVAPAKYAPIWTKRGRTERWESLRNLMLNTYQYAWH